MKPTTTAESENRKKKEEPKKPNCAGSSFSSVMIGTPARPTTILSAKFTTMNRNSRNVIFQAPFGVSVGVACAAITLPRLGRFADRAEGNTSHAFAGGATAYLTGFACIAFNPL